MKQAAQQHNKSLKTFYLYAVFVFVAICISLLVKGFYIVKQSKYDPMHHFTLAVTEQRSVKEIISFNPQTPATSILVLQDVAPVTTIASKYGIATDGYIQQDSATTQTEATTFLSSSLLHMATWRSDLTIFDKIRLLLFAKSVTLNNRSVKTVSLAKPTAQTTSNIMNALTDQDIASENISIQIINATDISGFGQRLGKVLTNMGANVVDISSSQKMQPRTTITYFGNNSYTLGRLQKLLGVPATKLTRQSIADIIIIIGNDRRDLNTF